MSLYITLRLDFEYTPLSPHRVLRKRDVVTPTTEFWSDDRQTTTTVRFFYVALTSSPLQQKTAEAVLTHELCSGDGFCWSKERRRRYTIHDCPLLHTHIVHHQVT